MSRNATQIDQARNAAVALLKRYGRRVSVWRATEACVGPFHLLFGRVDAATEGLDIMYGPDTVATWQMRVDEPPTITHFDPGPWYEALLRLNGTEEWSLPDLS